MKDRLKKILEINDIKEADFCREIGVHRSYINSIRKGISQEKLSRIAKCYPSLNIKELITGTVEPLDKTGATVTRTGQTEWLYTHYLDLATLLEKNDKFKELLKENESLKDTIKKQNKIIKRLTDKIQKKNIKFGRLGGE